jgi:DNA repair exonuclease SbcCD nuclease subunit
MPQTIRLLHTADLHLDSPLRSLALRDDRLRDIVETASRTALSRLVDRAIDEEVRALLIAGDLFDGRERSARTGAFLVATFDRLRAAGIDVFAIRGNHDAENPVSGTMTWPDNVRVFDGRGGRARLGETDIWVHGVSFGGRHAPDSLLPKFGPPVPDAVNIGLLHTSLAGAPGHDAYAPCSVAELCAHGFDYWALGHVHARAVHAERPWVVMPGMPQGRDIGEAGPKSATLIEVTGGAVAAREVPTSVAEFRRVAIDVTGAGDETEIRRRLRAGLEEAARDSRSDAAILRLTLAGATPGAWALRRDRDLWAETARLMAEETGRLWIEELALDVAPPGEDAAAPADAVAELGRLMAALRAEPGFLAEARAEVEEVLRHLPPDRRAALLPGAAALDTLAERLAAAGADEMVARMRGAGRGDDGAGEDGGCA